MVLEAGQMAEIADGVRRLVAPNPGMMTGPGTNTYLLGRREIAVIDPGPAIDAHLRAILDGAGGAVRWILVTHTHPDHSPGAARLHEATGAPLLGRPPPCGRHQDASFRPERVLDDGARLATAEFELEAIHTPGHASNHLCYRYSGGYSGGYSAGYSGGYSGHAGLKWLFTGDHIIDGSTVVIDPPDGDMAAYLQSLARLKTLDIAAIAPGHGNVIEHPREAIERLIDHRLRREAKVAGALAAHPGSTLDTLVRHVYDEVDPGLHPIAERSLLAHLEKLEADARAVQRKAAWWPAA